MVGLSQDTVISLNHIELKKKRFLKNVTKVLSIALEPPDSIFSLFCSYSRVNGQCEGRISSQNERAN